MLAKARGSKLWLWWVLKSILKTDTLWFVVVVSHYGMKMFYLKWSKKNPQYPENWN